MSSDDFINYLNNKDITWKEFFIPQIEKIVRAVTTKANEFFDSKPNCFELFGFDFAIDKNLKIWLIEVNMSPACAERQPWLTSMLDDMSDGVTGIIQAKIN